MTQRPHHRHIQPGRSGASESAPGRAAASSGAASSAPGPSADELAAELEGLRSELAAVQAQAAENLAALQRSAADFANFRRRTAEDRERDLGLASESLLRKVLALADDFDRALEAMPEELKGSSWIEGIVLVDRKLRQLIESEGVTPIEAVGRPFDPREHEAIASWPSPDANDGDVVAEIQRGYRIRDRVLRPARVAVAAPGSGSGDTRGSGDAGGPGPANPANTERPN